MLQPGDCLAFDVTLLGTAIDYFHRAMLSLPIVETGGVGSRLRCLGGRRGRAHIQKVEALGLGESVQESLYERDRRVVRRPTVHITAEAVTRQAEQLATDRLTLEFLTPTRLKADGQWLTQPEFRPLILRLAERLEALEEAYGDDDGLGSQETRQINSQRYDSLGALASQVRMVAQQTVWIDLSSYSRRQSKVTPIGGFVGEATYEGELTDLREMLVWGEVCHVGKNTVKGDGCYRIVQPERR